MEYNAAPVKLLPKLETNIKDLSSIWFYVFSINFSVLNYF